MSLAKTEAKLLHDKITEKCYNDDDFIRIITTRSKAQINATLNHYKNEFGQDINKVWSCVKVYGSTVNASQMDRVDP